MRTYSVSGIAQFTIRAKNAEEAVRRAQAQADRLTKGRLIIALDNWQCDETRVIGRELDDTNED